MNLMKQIKFCKSHTACRKIDKRVDKFKAKDRKKSRDEEEKT